MSEVPGQEAPAQAFLWHIASRKQVRQKSQPWELSLYKRGFATNWRYGMKQLSCLLGGPEPTAWVGVWVKASGRRGAVISAP